MTIPEWQQRKIFLKKQIIKLIGGFPKHRSPLNVEVTNLTDQGDIFYEKVVYETEPGEKVFAFVLIPKKGKK